MSVTRASEELETALRSKILSLEDALDEQRGLYEVGISPATRTLSPLSLRSLCVLLSRIAYAPSPLGYPMIDGVCVGIGLRHEPYFLRALHVFF